MDEQRLTEIEERATGDSAWIEDYHLESIKEDIPALVDEVRRLAGIVASQSASVSLERLFSLEGVCSVTLESPDVICPSRTTPNEWWCHYHHHYPDGDTSNDYTHGATPLAAVQAAYDDQHRRVEGRVKES